MRWHRAGRLIESIVLGKKIRPQLSNLTHEQQEILCGEFLRLPEAESSGLPRLAHLLLPMGRTMRDIDIIGITTANKALLAQVTFDELPKAQWKLNRLLAYVVPKRSHLLLFCACEATLENQGVTIFPIQRVYDIFAATPHGEEWLRRSA